MTAYLIPDFTNRSASTFFSVAFEGTDSGDYYISGKGFIGGLAPSAAIDAAVWISPMTIVVNGEIARTAL